LTASGVILGTPSYMSPEQLQGREVDLRCDIFAFGVLLYELASGTHPFEGRTPFSTAARILEADPAPLPSEIAGGSQLDRIVRRCARKQPTDRYGSAAELIRDLQALQSGPAALLPSEPGASAASAGGPDSDTAKHWWQVHQAAVLALYALMAVGAWKVKEWQPSGTSLLLFFGVVICAAMGGTLRSHLLFVARFHPRELPRHLRRAQRWIRFCDWTFIGLLLAQGLALARERPVIAALIAAVAIAYLIVSLVVEPATAQAAFAKRGLKRPKSSVS